MQVTYLRLLWINERKGDLDLIFVKFTTFFKILFRDLSWESKENYFLIPNWIDLSLLNKAPLLFLAFFLFLFFMVHKRKELMPFLIMGEGAMLPSLLPFPISVHLSHHMGQDPPSKTHPPSSCRRFHQAHYLPTHLMLLPR